MRVAKVIDVHETEYRPNSSYIEIERFGYYGIKAINDGHLTHALRITGPGVAEHTGNIVLGKSATMLVFKVH